MIPTEAGLKRLNLVRRMIYLLVAAVMLLPYVVPLTLPFEPSKPSRQLFNRVDALKPGAHVLLAFDYDPAARAELRPMSVAILRHCFKKGLIPIVMTNWPNGVDMASDICRQAAEDAAEKWNRKIESGRDYVFLGLRPGGSNLVLKMGENIKKAFEKDFYDQPTEPMPALEGVRSLKDIDLAIDLAAGATVEMWIAYGADRYGFPLGAGTTAVQAPNLYPWLQSGQLVGLLGGLRGAADYEQLVEVPGNATKGMEAQSAIHVLLIVMLVGANVHMLSRRFVRNPRG